MTSAHSLRMTAIKSVLSQDLWTICNRLSCYQFITRSKSTWYLLQLKDQNKPLTILLIAYSRYPAISAIDSKNFLPSTRMCWKRYFRCETSQLSEPAGLVYSFVCKQSISTLSGWTRSKRWAFPARQLCVGQMMLNAKIHRNTRGWKNCLG